MTTQELRVCDCVLRLKDVGKEGEDRQLVSTEPCPVVPLDLITVLLEWKVSWGGAGYLKLWDPSSGHRGTGVDPFSTLQKSQTLEEIFTCTFTTNVC